MSWEKCLALYAEIRKANACDHQQTTWMKWYQNFHSEGARIRQLQFLEWRSELFSRKAREKDVMLYEHLPSKMKGSYGKLRFQTFSTFLSSFRKKTLRLSHSELTVSTLDSGQEVWDRNLAASHSWTRHSYSRYLSPPEGMNRYRRIFKVSERNAEGNLRWTSIPSRGSSCTLSRFMLHSPK